MLFSDFVAGVRLDPIGNPCLGRKMFPIRQLLVSLFRHPVESGDCLIKSSKTKFGIKPGWSKQLSMAHNQAGLFSGIWLFLPSFPIVDLQMFPRIRFYREFREPIGSASCPTFGLLE
jgi:hypothetical protein